VYPVAPDGTACNDGTACASLADASGETCMGGTCTPPLCPNGSACDPDAGCGP
jgi:hypothetical protein